VPAAGTAKVMLVSYMPMYDEGVGDGMAMAGP